MTVGERIKQKRIELGLSQEELAKKCGYKSRSSINKIEMSRDLPLAKVTLMANALDCSESYLMGWEEEKDFPEFEPEHIELIKLYSKLNEEQKKTVLTLLRSLAPSI